MNTAIYSELRLLQLECNRLVEFVTAASESYNPVAVGDANATLQEYAVIGALYSIRARMLNLAKPYYPASWNKIEDNYFHHGVVVSTNYGRMLRDLKGLSASLATEIRSIMEGVRKARAERKTIPFVHVAPESELTDDTQYVGILETYRHELTPELLGYLQAFELKAIGRAGAQVMFCRLYASVVDGFLLFGVNGDPVVSYTALTSLVANSSGNLALIGVRSAQEHRRRPAFLYGLDVLEEAETLSPYAKTEAYKLFKEFSKLRREGPVWETPLDVVESLCFLGQMSDDRRMLEHTAIYQMIDKLSRDDISSALVYLENSRRGVEDNRKVMEERGAFTAPRVLVHYIMLDKLLGPSGISSKIAEIGSKLMNLR